MSEAEERAYERGMRSVYREQLQNALRGLDQKDRDKSAWILEREAAIATLRQLCETHGDNDWPNDLHLSDIIDKHLGRYLG